MTEEWRIIERCQRYEVSSLGRVRNTETGHVLAALPNWKGYITVSLSKPGERSKKFSLARIICTAFHGEPSFEGAQAAHLDGCRANNVAANLAWVTSRENNAHRYLHGTVRPMLSEEEVSQIRDMAASGETHKTVARRFGISATTVWKIARGTYGQRFQNYMKTQQGTGAG